MAYGNQGFGGGYGGFDDDIDPLTGMPRGGGMGGGNMAPPMPGGSFAPPMPGAGAPAPLGTGSKAFGYGGGSPNTSRKISVPNPYGPEPEPDGGGFGGGGESDPGSIRGNRGAPPDPYGGAGVGTPKGQSYGGARYWQDYDVKRNIPAPEEIKNVVDPLAAIPSESGTPDPFFQTRDARQALLDALLAAKDGGMYEPSPGAAKPTPGVAAAAPEGEWDWDQKLKELYGKMSAGYDARDPELAKQEWAIKQAEMQAMNRARMARMGFGSSGAMNSLAMGTDMLGRLGLAKQLEDERLQAYGANLQGLGAAGGLLRYPMGEKSQAAEYAQRDKEQLAQQQQFNDWLEALAEMNASDESGPPMPGTAESLTGDERDVPGGTDAGGVGKDAAYDAAVMDKFYDDTGVKALRVSSWYDDGTPMLLVDEDNNSWKYDRGSKSWSREGERIPVLSDINEWWQNVGWNNG